MIMLNIEAAVRSFKSMSGADDRYSSFDYCYNYFRTTGNLLEDIEKSCLTLGFYLASWGMFRGSSFLLQKSVKHFQSTIEFVTTLDKTTWEIDVDKYSDANIQTIMQINKEIKSRLIPNGQSDLTLTTKIMLGVFGFVPAFDNYFCSAFRRIASGECGFRRINRQSLTLIRDFYQENKQDIDRLAKETFTIDFLSGRKTHLNYPKAKIIDMYGFTVGQGQQPSDIISKQA